MKKLIPIALLFFSVTIFAQNDDVLEKKHEIKGNAFNIIIFKAIDFSYEYLIDSESSFGASLLINLQGSDDYYSDEPYYYEKFAFTPYYRRYFSSKYAQGFFLEAFGMYNVQEDYESGYYDYTTDTYIDTDSNETSNNVAFGISVGGKFVSSKGFVFEFYGGVGRNIYQSNADFATELVPRLGASFGYRW